MNCEEFMVLSEMEKAIFIGQLVHVCQSDPVLFEAGKKLIERGERKGLFKGVKLFPSSPTPIENNISGRN
jgi:hypothetical protein